MDYWRWQAQEATEIEGGSRSGGGGVAEEESR